MTYFDSEYCVYHYYSTVGISGFCILERVPNDNNVLYYNIMIIIFMVLQRNLSIMDTLGPYFSPYYRGVLKSEVT